MRRVLPAVLEVAGEVALTGVGSLALRAPVQVVAVLAPHVSRDFGTLRASVVAEAALVRLLARVRPPVDSEVGFLREALSAELASILWDDLAAQGGSVRLEYCAFGVLFALSVAAAAATEPGQNRPSPNDGHGHLPHSQLLFV